MTSLRGKWTEPGFPFASSHLVIRDEGGELRCGRHLEHHEMDESLVVACLTSEPPARGKTCERCLVLSRMDG